MSLAKSTGASHKTNSKRTATLLLLLCLSRNNIAIRERLIILIFNRLNTWIVIISALYEICDIRYMIKIVIICCIICFDRYF